MQSRPTDAYFYNRVTKEVREAPPAEETSAAAPVAATTASLLSICARAGLHAAERPSLGLMRWLVCSRGSARRGAHRSSV